VSARWPCLSLQHETSGPAAQPVLSVMARQKPVKVSAIARLTPVASDDARTILDPFMGSGTTLVACQKLGRAGIGIEIDPEYFAIACKRVDEAMRQKDLFIAPAPQPVQEGLDL